MNRFGCLVLGCMYSTPRLATVKDFHRHLDEHHNYDDQLYTCHQRGFVPRDDRPGPTILKHILTREAQHCQ